MRINASIAIRTTLNISSTAVSSKIQMSVCPQKTHYDIPFSENPVLHPLLYSIFVILATNVVGGDIMIPQPVLLHPVMKRLELGTFPRPLIHPYLNFVSTSQTVILQNYLILQASHLLLQQMRHHINYMANPM
jgi:hypothetical protein